MEKKVDLTGYPVNNSPTPVNWRGKIIHVKPLLDPDELCSFVREIISLCYDEQSDMMIPEYSDYYFRACTIKWYTDIVLPDVENEAYQILYLTDIYETVTKKVSAAQINGAKQVVDTTIYGYKLN